MNTGTSQFNGTTNIKILVNYVTIYIYIYSIANQLK